MCVKCRSILSDSATPWTVAHQAPLFKEFSRQEYWSGLQCTPPEDLPDAWIEPESQMAGLSWGKDGKVLPERHELSYWWSERAVDDHWFLSTYCVASTCLEMPFTDVMPFNAHNNPMLKMPLPLFHRLRSRE